MVPTVHTHYSEIIQAVLFLCVLLRLENQQSKQRTVLWFSTKPNRELWEQRTAFIIQGTDFLVSFLHNFWRWSNFFVHVALCQGVWIARRHRPTRLGIGPSIIKISKINILMLKNMNYSNCCHIFDTICCDCYHPTISFSFSGINQDTEWQWIFWCCQRCRILTHGFLQWISQRSDWNIPKDTVDILGQ